MYSEKLGPNRGTLLRKNGAKSLFIDVNMKDLKDIFLINGNKFFTDDISSHDLIVPPNEYYMIINRADKEIHIKYNLDVSQHQVIYNPYKYENAQKTQIDPVEFRKSHEVPEGYIDILPKWYSIKFTYPEYNLIFIKPEMGISFQIHRERSEYWEIIKGKPIILTGHRVYYFVDSGTHIKNPVGSYHSIINPNTQKDKFVVLKERWSGHFDEEDIKRVFNPNNYQ
jgi:mannose-6-phosphate isomerase-like protein (cupin superfamily)